MNDKANKKAARRASSEPVFLFSKSKSAFYIKSLHAEVPKDVVEVSKDDHDQLFRDLNDDPAKCLGADDKGRPVVCDRPETSREEYEAAVDSGLSNLFDQQARELGYKDAATLASYGLSTNETYKAEAEAFIAWRDKCCHVIYKKLKDIPDGGRPSAEVVLNNAPKFKKG